MTEKLTQENKNDFQNEINDWLVDTNFIEADKREELDQLWEEIWREIDEGRK